MGRQTGRLIMTVAACLSLAGGCAKKAGESRAPSADAGEFAGGDSDDPLVRLDAYEAQLRSFGVKPSARDAADKKHKDERAIDERAGEGGVGEVADAEAPAFEEDAVPPEPAAVAEPEVMPGDGEFAEEASRCPDLCSLSEAICELEVRICEMSEDHAGDETYADACERAIDDCALSGDACDSCH